MRCKECQHEFNRKEGRGRIPIFCSIKCQHKNWIKRNPEYNEKSKLKQREYNKRKKKAKGLRNIGDPPKYYCKVCGYVWRGRKYPYRCAGCLIKSWDFGTNLKCKICYRLIPFPVIHHIDGNNKNNKKENRVPICIDCHIAIHQGIGINKTKHKSLRARNKQRMYGTTGRYNSGDMETIYNIKKYQRLLHGRQ